MKKKKLHSISVAALVLSVLPLAALIPSLLHLSLPDGIRTVWAGVNIVFVLLGLILSAACVRNRESRSAAKHRIHGYMYVLDVDDGWIFSACSVYFVCPITARTCLILSSRLKAHWLVPARNPQPDTVAFHFHGNTKAP